MRPRTSLGTCRTATKRGASWSKSGERDAKEERRLAAYVCAGILGLHFSWSRSSIRVPSLWPPSPSALRAKPLADAMAVRRLDTSPPFSPNAALPSVTKVALLVKSTQWPKGAAQAQCPYALPVCLCLIASHLCKLHQPTQWLSRIMSVTTMLTCPFTQYARAPDLPRQQRT